MAAAPSTASHSSSSSSSSSSSFSYSFTYDVFFRFRDLHTPHGFFVLLYKFLRHKGISTFIHGEEKAADLSGNDFKLGMNGSIECVVVEKIVRWVSRIVSSVPLHGWDCPVGQESQELNLIWLLNDGSYGGVYKLQILGMSGVYKLQILGMSGVGKITLGKTTLAQAVFNWNL